MTKNLIRFSQVPVGAIFKCYGAIYKKIHQTKGMNGKADYQHNALRLDNGKTFKLHGNYPVEIISYDNETKN